jgi:voltage-gated potassium channel Kch
MTILVLDSYTWIDKADDLFPLDAVVISFFTIEYILRFYASADDWRCTLRFLFNPLNVADLLSLVPFYLLTLLVKILHLNMLNLDAMRVMRLFRMVKLAQYSRRFKLLTSSIVKSIGMLLSVIYFIIIIVFITSTLEYYAERGTLNKEGTEFVRADGTPSPFNSIPASMWWSIVTLVTLGYGDMVPVTPLGKAIASLTMILGVLIIALPSMIIGKVFSELSQNYAEERIREKEQVMSRTLEAMTEKKSELDQLWERQEAMMKMIATLMQEMEENSKLISAMKMQAIQAVPTVVELADIKV